jgi:transmembrane sensor
MTGKRVFPLKPNNEKPQASDWLAKLDRGDLTVDEREAFAQWLNEDPGNNDAIQALAAFWYGINEPLSQLLEPPSSTTGDCIDVTSSLQGLAYTFFNLRRLSFVSVCILIAGTLILFFKSGESKFEEQYYSTKIGETRIISLQDHSKIHLNTNSIIETDFSNNARVIRLLSGEAIFDVAHDKNRPFKVFTTGDIIRAVGTRFAVRVGPDKVHVTVTQGRVALEKRVDLGHVIDRLQVDTKLTDIDPVILSQGEIADIDTESGRATRVASDRDIAERLAWAKGQLVFYDKELQFVIDEIARYTTVKITVVDDALKSRKISGVLQLGDVKMMLEGLEGALGVKSFWVSDTQVQISNG